MVVHVAPRGKDMAGLMRYLYGPGRANEHTDQRAVAASGDLHVAYSGALTPVEASELGRLVESSWHEQMAETNALAGVGRGGVSRSTLTRGGGPVAEGDKEHTYHLILSLPPGEAWSDEQWATIARDTMEGMGFTTGGDDVSNKWVAVRHGLSSGGNDHLHIVADLTRQDGVRFWPRADFRLANDVRRAMETKHSFVLPLHEVGHAPERSLPGYTMAEHAKAKERAVADGVDVVPDRVLLQQWVRSAAAGAATEEEWLNALLDAPDVEVEPARWVAGGRTEVSGYKVRRGDGPWFSASQLAPDLTLSKLRPRWVEHESTASRAAATAIWRADCDLPEAATTATPTATLANAEEALAQWVEELGTADVDDARHWQEATRDVAGVTSTLIRNAGSVTGHLASAGQTLSRQALPVARVPADPLPAPAATALPADVTAPTRRDAATDTARAPRPTTRPPRAQVAARQVQLALRAASVDSHPGWLAVLQQLQAVMRAVEAARHARGELAAARALAAAAADVERAHSIISDQLGAGTNDAALLEGWAAREASRVNSRGPRTPAPAVSTDGIERTTDDGLAPRSHPSPDRDRGRTR